MQPAPVTPIAGGQPAAAPETKIKDFHGLLEAIDSQPDWMHWVPGFSLMHQAVGGMGELARTVEGGRRLMGMGSMMEAERRYMPGFNQEGPPGPNDVLGQLAAHKSTNIQQSMGATGETLGEFASGEELLGLLGRSAKLLPFAEQFKLATGLAQMLDKYPLVAKLMKIGIASANQGTVAAGQTYLKTGDIGEAARTGLITAGTTALAAPVMAGGAALLGKGVEAGQEAAAARQAQKAGRQVTDEQIAQAQQARQTAIEQNAQNREQYMQARATHAATVKAGEAAHEATVVEPAKAAHAQEVEAGKATHAEQVRQAKATHAATVEAGEAAHAETVRQARTAYGQEVAAGEAAHAETVRQAKATHAATVEAGQAEHAQRVEQATQRATAAAQAEAAAGRAEAAQTYGRTAGQAIEPHLRAVEEAGQGRPVTMAQPGGAAPVVVGTTRPLTSINTNEILNRVGDYTTARDEFRTALNDSMDAIDSETGGKFRDLNAEVAAAQTHMHNDPLDAEAVRAYKQKLGELDDLISKTKSVRPDYVSAVRSGWRQYYVMGDIAKGLDKSLMGVPGGSAVSQAQRGINGRVGTAELGKLVIAHGRPAIAEAMGGEDRLRTIESVFEKMSTNNGRAQMNKAILNIAKYLEPVAPYEPPQYVPPAPYQKPEFVAPPKYKAPEFVPPAPYKAPEFKAPEYQPPAPPERPARVPVPNVPSRPLALKPEPTAQGAIGKVLRHTVATTAAIGAYRAGGGFIGGTMAAATAEAALHSVPVIARRVQDAMLSNPQVAKNILYAVEYGAKPENYGPFIAQMVRKLNEQPKQEETNANTSR